MLTSRLSIQFEAQFTVAKAGLPLRFSAGMLFISQSRCVRPVKYSIPCKVSIPMFGTLTVCTAEISASLRTPLPSASKFS